MTRLGLVALVAALAVVVAAPAPASTVTPGKARIAKKCKKKHGKKKKCKKSVPAPVVTPPAAPPTPLALTDAEVISRVTQKAFDYCTVDVDCVDYGYYYDTSSTVADCSSKSTYSWTCYGWNDEDDGIDPPFTCDFREVVERTGYNGITSHQDLTYGTDGWFCF